MNASRTDRRRQHGYTLIESVIAVTLLGLVIGSITMVGRAHERAYHTAATASQLEAQAALAMERIMTDLRIAARESITPDPGAVGTAGVQYVQAVGIALGEVELSPLRAVRFEYELGEIDDGIDNNGNGLVDEGRVVLIENLGEPNERTRVITRWVRELSGGEQDNGLDDNGNGLVDEPGFVLRRVDETLIVRLTLERRDVEGRTMSRTAQTSIRPRN